MHRSLRHATLLLGIVLGMNTLLSCTSCKKSKAPIAIRDFATIEEEGVLRVATAYNALNFYVEKEDTAGLYYELLQHFADAYQLEVNFTPFVSYNKQKEELLKGNYDIMAANIPITNRSKQQIALTHPLLLSKQLLIQRKPSAEDSAFIKSPLQLGGKTIYTIKNSPAIMRIKHLCQEIADTIYTLEIAHYGEEQLMAMVAHGDIDYAICSEAIAKRNKAQLENLDISIPIGFTQLIAWGVNKESYQLLDTLNKWIDHFKTTRKYKSLLREYQ
ncbi:MAG: transporter substrate-binding domain-containing protein [Bacteroidaceae bacterium]|nr:transporter substrate-binding domain-containing protein [Bacteroidaceae bacterium]